MSAPTWRSSAASTPSSSPAGVGERAAAVRAASLAGLEGFGIAVDPERNEAGGDAARFVSADDARVAVVVVPADEELEIGRQALAAVPGG